MRLLINIIFLIALLNSCKEPDKAAIKHFDQTEKIVLPYFNGVRDLTTEIKNQILLDADERDLTQFEVKYRDLIDLSISSINLLSTVDTLEEARLIPMSKEAIYSVDYCVRNSFKKAIDSLKNGSKEIEYARHLSRGMNELILINHGYQLAQLDFAKQYKFDIEPRFDISEYSEYVQVNDSILSLYDNTLDADIFAVFKRNGQLSQKVMVKNDTLLYKKVFSDNNEALDEYYSVMIGKRTPIKKVYKLGDTVNIAFDVMYTDYNLLVDLYPCDQIDNSMSYLVKNREVVSNHFDTTLVLSKVGEFNTCFNIREIKEFGIDSAISGTNGGYELAFSLLVE